VRIGEGQRRRGRRRYTGDENCGGFKFLADKLFCFPLICEIRVIRGSLG
jgi:hypothetical protein